ERSFYASHDPRLSRAAERHTLRANPVQDTAADYRRHSGGAAVAGGEHFARPAMAAAARATEHADDRRAGAADAAARREPHQPAYLGPTAPGRHHGACPEARRRRDRTARQRPDARGPVLRHLVARQPHRRLRPDGGLGARSLGRRRRHRTDPRPHWLHAQRHEQPALPVDALEHQPAVRVHSRGPRPGARRATDARRPHDAGDPRPRGTGANIRRPPEESLRRAALRLLLHLPARLRRRRHGGTLAAPFTAEPTELARLVKRYAGLAWDTQGIGFLQEYDRERRWVKTWIVDATKPGTAPVLLFDRSAEERYSDPGFPLMRMTPAG